ncbi:hypothetical protein OG233_16215 [Streptomyces sp. NBC_01218]|uniref:hypothetical protein n=1 Tax=Streptomyces sp. NBC_01218 TaxID=2903780 RepID=UPI002E11F492|nr:hypothetical protein OG233_16215 [Streptomyces sp. NBC_01218]
MDTRDSFTVGAVVRLAEYDPAHPMALLSLGAAGTDTLQLRYDPAPRAWQLVLPASARRQARTGSSPRTERWPTRPSGSRSSTPTRPPSTPTRRRRIPGTPDRRPARRGPVAGGPGADRRRWGDYLHGDVDEVEVYAGALPGNRIPLLGHGIGAA